MAKVRNLQNMERTARLPPAASRIKQSVTDTWVKTTSCPFTLPFRFSLSRFSFHPLLLNTTLDSSLAGLTSESSSGSESAHDVRHLEFTLPLLARPLFSWFLAPTLFLISLRRRGAVFVQSSGFGVDSAVGFPRSRMYSPLGLSPSYKTSSADSRRPTSRQRYFYTMFAQTTSCL